MKPVKWLVLVGVVCAGSLAFHLAVTRQGTDELAEQRAQEERLNKANEQLRETNAALAREAQRLRDDPRRLEQVARDEQGLIRPGETVFNFGAGASGGGNGGGKTNQDGQHGQRDGGILQRP